VAAPSFRNRSSTAWSSASSSVSRVVPARKGAKYSMLSPASAARPSYWVPEPRTRFRRPARVSSSSALKSTSMSTGADVSSAEIVAPSASSSPLFGPGFSEMYRLVMPDSEVARIVAAVSSWSGARPSSISIVTRAFADLSSSISEMVPTDWPPTRTSLPGTSWPALSNTALTV
jgi:hypothetical protein